MSSNRERRVSSSSWSTRVATSRSVIVVSFAASRERSFPASALVQRQNTQHGMRQTHRCTAVGAIVRARDRDRELQSYLESRRNRGPRRGRRRRRGRGQRTGDPGLRPRTGPQGSRDLDAKRLGTPSRPVLGPCEPPRLRAESTQSNRRLPRPPRCHRAREEGQGAGTSILFVNDNMGHSQAS